MRPGYALSRLTRAALATLLLTTVAAVPPMVAAADADDFDASADQVQKQLKLRPQFVRWTDGTSEIVSMTTGQTLVGFGEMDVTDMAYAVVKLTKPMIKQLEKRAKAKLTEAFVGNQAELKPGQQALVVYFTTAEPLDGVIPGGVQGLIGFAGSDGVPLYPGAGWDARSGNETLVTFGQWPEIDGLLIATTPLDGVGIDEVPQWNSGDPAGFGYQDDLAWVVVYPIPEGAATFDLRLQGFQGEEPIVDVFTTPTGRTEFPLDDRPIGDDACLWGSAFAEQDAAGNVASHLVELTWSPVGSLAEAGAPPIMLINDNTGASLPMEFVVFPEIDAATLFGSAPSGIWRLTFETVPRVESDSMDDLADGAIMDLTGNRSGPFLGDRPCGHVGGLALEIPRSALEAFAAAVDVSLEDAAYANVRTPDGTALGALVDAQGAPTLILSASGRPVSRGLFDLRVAASTCESETVDFKDAAVVEGCPDGTQRLFFLDLFETDAGQAEFGRVFSAEVRPGAFPDGAADDVHPIFSELAVRRAVAHAFDPDMLLLPDGRDPDF